MDNQPPQENTLLSANLKALRKQVKMTQAQISKVIGVTRSAYAYYENGTTNPKLETLKKIATAFNVEVDDILNKNFSSDNDVSQKETYDIELNGFDDSFNDLTDIEKAVVLKLRIMSREQRTNILDQILG